MIISTGLAGVQRLAQESKIRRIRLVCTQETLETHWQAHWLTLYF